MWTSDTCEEKERYLLRGLWGWVVQSTDQKGMCRRKCMFRFLFSFEKCFRKERSTKEKVHNDCKKE